MPALDGALALREGHNIASAIPKDLDLDVAGVLHVFLHKHAAVAKGGLALARRRLKVGADLQSTRGV